MAMTELVEQTRLAYPEVGDVFGEASRATVGFIVLMVHSDFVF